MKPCLFCDQAVIADGLIAETENFYVRANINPIAPGHVMLISKIHYPCFGEMSSALDKEYDALHNSLEDQIQALYSSPMVVEQGIHGQSVPHAHTHFFPSISGWYDFSKIDYVSLVPSEIPIASVEGITEIRRIFQEDGQYVTIGEKNKLYVCRTKDYLGSLRPVREFPARFTGRNDLIDWHIMSEDAKKQSQQWVQETIETLKC